jgi:hypothetical protein
MSFTLFQPLRPEFTTLTPDLLICSVQIRFTPVVVGHSATILKLNLTPFVVASLAAPITVAVAPSDDSAGVETKKADETVADPDVIPVAKKEEPTEKAVPLT